MMKSIKLFLIFIVFMIFHINASANLPEGARAFVRSTESGLSDYNSTLKESGFRTGKSYALVVGIYDYDFWDDFDWKDSDLRRMEKVLFEVQGFDEVVVLEQEHVTADSIQKAIEFFAAKISSRDRFLFYFTGHGVDVVNEFGGRTGVLPVVGSELSVGLNDGGISMDAMEDWHKKVSKANHILFILDSCFSGLAGSNVKGISKEQEYRLSRLLNSGHYLVTAGAHNQKSIGSERWGGSLFTSLIARGMSGDADILNEDGIISFGELFLYTKNKLDDVLGAMAEEEWDNGFEERTEMTPRSSRLGAYDRSGEMFFIPKPADIKLAFNEEPAVADLAAIQAKGLGIADRINYQEEYLRSQENATGDYFAIVGSFKDYKVARAFARKIRNDHPNLYAVVYDRYKDNEYFSVMMAAFVDKRTAEKARDLAISNAIAADAFLWTFPKD